jgi:hypothetical protein
MTQLRNNTTTGPVSSKNPGNYAQVIKPTPTTGLASASRQHDALANWAEGPGSPAELQLRRDALEAITYDAPATANEWNRSIRAAGDYQRALAAESREFGQEWGMHRRVAAQLDQQAADLVDDRERANEISAQLMAPRNRSHEMYLGRFQAPRAEGMSSDHHESVQHMAAYQAVLESAGNNKELLEIIGDAVREDRDVLLNAAGPVARRVTVDGDPGQWGSKITQRIGRDRAEKLESEASYVNLDSRLEELTTHIHEDEESFIAAAYRLFPEGAGHHEEQLRRDHRQQPAHYQLAQMKKGVVAREKRVAIYARADDPQPACSEIAYMDTLVADGQRTLDDQMADLLNQEDGGWAGRLNLKTLYLRRVTLSQKR